MSQYYLIDRSFALSSLVVKIDYDFAEVIDPSTIDSPLEVGSGFLKNYRFRVGPGELHDMQANTIGWKIVSPKLVRLLKEFAIHNELEFVPLPEQSIAQNHGLKGYCVLGIKEQVRCLNIEQSEVRWSHGPAGKHILAIYKWVLRSDCIPADCNIFHVAEYPVVTVVSHKLAYAMSSMQLSGITYEEIPAL